MTIATVSTCLVLAAVTFAPTATQHFAAKLVLAALILGTFCYTIVHALGGRGVRRPAGKSRGRDGPGGDGGGQAGRASGSGRMPGWAGPVPIVICVTIRGRAKGRTRKGG